MSEKRRLENEEQILKQVSEGDSQAFRTLYLHYYDRLFQFAMLFLQSEDASEDVVEDVFFILWRDRDILKSIPKFQAYIYQAVRNGCYNVLKSGYIAKRGEMPEMEVSIRISESPLDELAYKELYTAVKEAVGSLPDRCRTIFKMSREDEMSHREIAEALNVKICTVERQILLAKAKLKQALEPFLEKL